MPFCLQKTFSREISNMQVFLGQLNLQVQLTDLENLFVSFMSTVDITVVVTVLVNFRQKLPHVHFYTKTSSQLDKHPRIKIGQNVS